MSKDFQQAIVRAVRAELDKRFAKLEPRFSELQQRQMTPGPQGERGEPGQSVKAEDVLSILRAELMEMVKAIPPPKDGQRGEQGPQGAPGERGEPGPRGDAGQPGKSITLDDVRPLIESMQAKWELDFERRALATMEKAIDRMPSPKDGKDGADGRDGLGIDDLTVEHDGERTVTVVYERDGRRKEFPFQIPAMIYRGTYKPDHEYQRGDVVTWGGGMSVCLEPTSEKPGTGKAWQVAVRKGRDAR